jgi:hypothetical protein
MLTDAGNQDVRGGICELGRHVVEENKLLNRRRSRTVT